MADNQRTVMFGSCRLKELLLLRYKRLLLCGGGGGGEQVIDTNSTSLVTPRLTHASPCHAHALEARTTLRLSEWRPLRRVPRWWCVCPGRTSGPQCKVLGRTFWGSGWAWLRPLPPCLPTTISLRLLTRRPHGLLLYAGPLAPPLRRTAPAPMLTLQLVGGRPQALVEGAGVSLKLHVNTSLSDGRWHTLHLVLDNQSVVLMVDLCGRGWEDKIGEGTHCLARGKWRPLQSGGPWLSSAPLQMGGFAHAPPGREQHGWREAPTRHHLTGCLSHITINSQMIDFGEPAYSHDSASGCLPQDAACAGGCGVRGRCVGGLVLPRCDCEPGWTGPHCASPTVPTRLGAASYMKVALSFTPNPRVIKLQVRVRLRGARSGLLLHLAAHHRAAAVTLHLKAGVACASMSGAGWAARKACVERRPLGDGTWHTVVAERHGHNLRLSVDDGDGWSLSETLASVDTPAGEEPPPSLMVDKHDGVTVGGLPEFVGVNLVTVHDDLQDTCLDDLRVSDHQLPLPPAVNGTTWGQVTTMEHLVEGCHPPGDPCANISCAAPRSCRATWDQPSCSCGPGRRVVDGACEDVDECQWRPCLHGGSCLNLQPGYLCVCGPGHVGDHCQWSKLASSGHPVAAPAAIAAITVSVLVLVVLGVVLSLRLHRLRGAHGLQAGTVKGGIQSVKGTAVEGSEEGSVGEAAVREGSSDTLMELLKLRVSRDPSGLSEEHSTAPAGWESCGSILVETQHLPAMHREDPPACHCGENTASGHRGSSVSGEAAREARTKASRTVRRSTAAKQQQTRKAALLRELSGQRYTGFPAPRLARRASACASPAGGGGEEAVHAVACNGARRGGERRLGNTHPREAEARAATRRCVAVAELLW
ncbi:hypothetical protein O3P69_014994 [Scylla paramamosain]|uniref:Neural-cadherin n=1 Tax=Scylla paramamosain TaxID=85552 RepID=A0AAW0SGZ3_SCYPA